MSIALARRLIESSTITTDAAWLAAVVKMHGELVPVRARVEQIAEFSVHADSNELIEWLRSTSVEPGQVFVVHGEAGVAESFSDSIVAKLGWKSKAPKDGEEVLL